MENLKKENESLKNEISHWMNESAQKDRAIEALSMKNVSLKNELAAKNSKIEASAEEMETLKKLVQQFCIDIKILKKKIQELEKHNKELRMDCEKKCQSLMEAKSRERKLWSRLDKANDEKRQWIKNYEAAGQKLKDQNKELKEKELVKRELTRQMECLSKHLCQNNCVSLAVLHILSEMKISNWCEHILGKTAVLAALQNGADPSDKDLVCCTKAIQLLEKAAFVGCVAEGVEIAKVDDLLQQFKKHFPGVFGILAFLYPHKVGHAVAVKPASQVPILYCPQTGQHLRVEDFKQNGATVVSLYILNVDCIGKTKEQFSLTDDSRGIYCLGNFPGAAEF